MCLYPSQENQPLLPPHKQGEKGAVPDPGREARDLQNFDVSVAVATHLALAVFSVVEPPPVEPEALEVDPVLAILDVGVRENRVRKESYVQEKKVSPSSFSLSTL